MAGGHVVLHDTYSGVYKACAHTFLHPTHVRGTPTEETERALGAGPPLRPAAPIEYRSSGATTTRQTAVYSSTFEKIGHDETITR